MREPPIPSSAQGRPLRALFLGFGHVGREVARLLVRRHEHPGLAGLDLRVVGIVSGAHGALADPAGLDLAAALEAYGAGGFTPADPGFSELDARAAADRLEYDVLVEMTPLDLAGRGAATIARVRAALERGRHVVSANKGPVAWAYRSLRDLARERGASFRFEATVMDGAPVFGLACSALPGATIERLAGVLNSTSNVVLGAMEEGLGLEPAVGRARELGIAEADPSADLQGWDAAVKLAALANVLLVRDGEPELRPEAVSREAVEAPLGERARRARAGGRRLKMVCEAAREGGTVRAGVAARELPADHPFARLDGTSSALTITADLLGTITLVEEAPGLTTTAYGVLADLLRLA